MVSLGCFIVVLLLRILVIMGKLVRMNTKILYFFSFKLVLSGEFRSRTNIYYKVSWWHWLPYGTALLWKVKRIYRLNQNSREAFAWVLAFPLYFIFFSDVETSKCNFQTLKCKERIILERENSVLRIDERWGERK